MSFFKSIFSSKKDTELRHLKHVTELKQGDAVEFSDSFVLPELIRKQHFTIKQVNTYQYERKSSIEWVLQGTSPEDIYMSYEKDDEEWLNLSLKLNRDQVASIFDLDNFADTFEDNGATELALQQQNPAYNNWLAPIYFQHAYATRGYFYAKDFRPAKPPTHQDNEAEALDYFGLTSTDEKFSVDIEVWEGGETDVSLTIHRPLTDVIGLYPGA